MAEAKKKTAPKRARKPAQKNTKPPVSESTDKSPEQQIPEQQIPKFVRNRSGAPFRMKLSRHTPGQQGIALKPRGERGDMAPIEIDDLNDIILQDSISLGLVELITADQANNSMSKQTINQQAAHPALAALKNQHDKGDMKVVATVSDEDRGVVVAEMENGQIAVGRDGNIRRPGESPGTPANIPGAEPGRAPADEEASLLSDLRSKTSVDPVQKGGS